MNKYPPAGFFLRLLAYLNEKMVFMVFASIIIFNISKSTTLNAVYAGIVSLLIFVVFYLLLGMVYNVLFTYYFGGDLGKLLTGLRVGSQSGGTLEFKKILFRQLLAYRFSWLVFGLGFLSILRDTYKQAWHDKTVNSNVFKVQPLLPLGAVVFLVAIGLVGYLLSTGVQNFLNSPVKQEVLGLVSSFSQQNRVPKITKDEQNLIPDSGMPAIELPAQTNLPVQQIGPGYTKEDVDSLVSNLDQADRDMKNIQGFKGSSSYNQQTVEKIIQIIPQRKALAQKLLDKMGKSQALTMVDFAIWDQYEALSAQQDSLVSSLYNGNGGF